MKFPLQYADDELSVVAKDRTTGEEQVSKIKYGFEDHFGGVVPPPAPTSENPIVVLLLRFFLIIDTRMD